MTSKVLATGQRNTATPGRLTTYKLTTWSPMMGHTVKLNREGGSSIWEWMTALSRSRKNVFLLSLYINIYIERREIERPHTYVIWLGCPQ